VTFGYTTDFDMVRANIRMAAEALERRARGEALIAELDARLAALARRETDAPAALYVTPGGVTAGAGTMVDAIFAAAGVNNAAAQAGLSGWPPLPAETLVLDPPGAIVAGFFTLASERASNWSAARHPAFRAVFEQAQVVHLPADLLSCPAWFSVEAAERIAAGLGSAGVRHAAE
jgi:iron complex transport system substrate-binding protein